ncbi:Isrso8-transposase orfb protein [Candidatus Jidaibacter acanthamoeba]|uniref:Isrso8-transposase orfb protein n=1 Tax=Candidatus Jidaibacter acanthamoebae TaxID=86105 RepID=A0A0C1MZ15_9RICK|nr:IS3 family transposase [Candidatus Jidaibacter acanthamoeba]KIE05226.1 Isrso8-transposase orfb protein [Candidatus Jidaibacter acanthamoeba]
MKKGLSHLFREKVERFKFMQKYKDKFKLERMAKMLKVSRSGYYKYLNSKIERKEDKDLRLVTEIKAIYSYSRSTYGSPRIYAELRLKGEKVNRKRVERLMRIHNIKAKRKGGYKIRHKPALREIKENLIKQDFRCNKPNEKWVSDISYIPTSLGWIYLAVILDLFSKKVVGMALDSKIDTNLIIKAFDQAISRRDINHGLIFHSDRGSQYTCGKFQKILALKQISCSMSAKGNCYDNAVAESFFSCVIHIPSYHWNIRLTLD